jgi:hypothetical protein
MRWALNGGPELVVGRVIADGVLSWVDGFREGFRVGDGEGEHGVVDLRGGGTRREKARWRGIVVVG